MTNILFRIPAVRERESYAIELCDSIGEPHESIYWDDDRNGSVWNKFKIWRLYEKHPEATHICMLDDDAEVVHGFKDFVRIAADMFPDAILSFCHCNANPVRMKEKAKNTPYMLLKNFDFRGISVCVPTKYLKDYMRFHEEKLYWYKHDDTSLKMYAVLNSIPCILTVPNLVRAKEIPSAIHPWCQVRNSDLWIGYDVDINQFKTSEYSIRKSEKMFDLHTSKNYPVLDDVRKAYARWLALMRIQESE